MLSDSQTIKDCAVATLSIKTGCSSQIISGNTTVLFSTFWRVTLLANELGPSIKIVSFASLGDVLMGLYALSNNHMRECIQHCYISTRAHRQVEVCPDMWRVDQFYLARIDNNQLCPLTQPTLQTRSKYRVRFRRVGSHDNNDISFSNRRKGLSPSGLTEGRF